MRGLRPLIPPSGRSFSSRAPRQPRPGGPGSATLRPATTSPTARSGSWPARRTRTSWSVGRRGTDPPRWRHAAPASGSASQHGRCVGAPGGV